MKRVEVVFTKNHTHAGIPYCTGDHIKGVATGMADLIVAMGVGEVVKPQGRVELPSETAELEE